MGGCKKEIAQLKLLTDCPADSETMLFMGASGGEGNGGYARREWQKIKSCIAAGSTPPDDLYFRVPDTGSSYINNGGNIITLPATFLGWRVRLIRNNTPVDYGDQGLGDPYFTQDISTNTLGLSADAVTDEKFMVWAYKYVGT